MPLRDFQAIAQNRAFELWQEPDVMNIGFQLPTGGGKSVVIADTVRKFDVPGCLIAHRQELVSQLSLALNREDVQHDIIAPKKIRDQIIKLHHDTHGRSKYRHRSPVRVAGVDSLDNDDHDRWFSQVGLVVVDEGHHVLKANKWGKAMALFPNARGLFPTAHLLRADGRGLGRTASGLMDRMVLGPSARELIGRGYLTDYDIYCPESDVDFSGVAVSAATGDYSQPQLIAATHKSKQLVGDVVREYLRYAPGKLGVTFAVDIEDAKKIAAAFNEAGVPAEVITSKTPIGVRGSLMRMFRERRLLQLVSVDCLGEGVDVPAIEVVSMARRTASFQLFAQQLGRALRIMVSDIENALWGSYSDAERLLRIASSGKIKAIIIDHVGNACYFAQYHGRPCSRQQYDLSDNERPPRRPLESLRPCIACAKPYKRTATECPYCQHVPLVAARSTPEQVEGDIVLLDPAVLTAMQQKVADIDGPPPEVAGYSRVIANTMLKRHRDAQSHQQRLRMAMLLWRGWQVTLGLAHDGGSFDREACKIFWATFGIDYLSAQALGPKEAEELEMRIRGELERNGVEEALAA